MQKPFEAPMYPLPKRPMLRGVARLFDFTGSLDREYRQRVLDYYNDARSERLADRSLDRNGDELLSGWEQDAEAISGYWQTVGDSMRWAMGELDKELSESESAS